MPNPTRDELRQAIRRCRGGSCIGCPLENKKCGEIMDRALLAYMEREEKVTLPAMRYSLNELGGPLSSADTITIKRKLDAAIKAIEEGR